MKRIIVFIGLIAAFLCIAKVAWSYDDKDSHPRITERAVDYSKLDVVLTERLGFPEGPRSLINGNSILKLFREGSTAEDSPNCRAANHFHNPLLPWYSSAMTDFPNAIYTYCQYKYPEYIPYYSTITWATGYPFAGSPTKDGGSV